MRRRNKRRRRKIIWNLDEDITSVGSCDSASKLGLSMFSSRKTFGLCRVKEVVMMLRHCLAKLTECCRNILYT